MVAWQNRRTVCVVFISYIIINVGKRNEKNYIKFSN